MLSFFTLLVASIAFANAADVNFDCTPTGPITQYTCANMCYHSNHFDYAEMNFDDPAADVKRQRRNAAGCGANNRCIANPPDTSRTTCDEYPFASTTGWFDGTGAGTRCVSLDECRSQGGSISAAYRAFGRVAGTPIDAVFTFDDTDTNSWCADPAKASDGQFEEGIAPPVKRNSASMPRRRTTIPVQNVYRLASGRKVLAIGRELANGTNVFIASDWQAKYPGVVAAAGLTKRQEDDNDACGATADALFEAVQKVPVEDVGFFDPVVEHVSSK